MRRRWRLWLLLALAGLLAAAWLGGRRSPTLRGPDGAKLRLRGVTFGTNHYAPPKRWNRIKANLPTALTDRLGLIQPTPVRRLRPSLVLWLDVAAHEEQAGRLRPRVEMYDADGRSHWPIAQPLSDVELISASGSPASRFPLSSVLQEGIEVSLFPRRESVLTFRVSLAWDSPSTATPREMIRPVLGHLRVPNPAFADYPVWEADAVPTSRIQDGVVAELRSFRVTYERKSLTASSASAVLRVGDGERFYHGWKAEGVELTDPTGNRVAYGVPLSISRGPSFYQEALGDGELALTFPWPAWVREPVWEMRVKLSPGALLGLGPGDEGIWLEGLTVPPADEVSRIDRHVTLAGHTIEVVALMGEFANLVGRERDVYGQTTLELEVPALPEGWEVEVLGVRAEGEVWDRVGDPHRDTRSVGLPSLKGWRTIDIALAVFRTRQVSFRVEETLDSRGGP